MTDANARQAVDEPGLHRVLIEAARKMRPRDRYVLGLTAAVLLTVTLWIVWDVAILDDEAGSTLEAVGLMLGNLGLLFITVGHTLHMASQTGSAACGQWRLSMPRLRTERLHQVLRATPILGTLALCSIAAGIACMASVVGDEPLRMPLAIGLYGAYGVWAARMVLDSTRFLYTHARQQAEAAAAARTEATEAKLGALQAQTNPHFLFNALNTVASLVRTDAAAAEATVENLARVLRRTLDRSRRVLTSVADEVDYLRAYLSVEKERLGDRLCVDWSVDPEALDERIPPMTLQPLVENALKHGIGNRLEGGNLRVSVRAGAERLEMTVEDDGPGFPRRMSEGTGLENLRRRLETLYGDSGELILERPARVTVSIPRGDAALRVDAEAIESRQASGEAVAASEPAPVGPADAPDEPATDRPAGRPVDVPGERPAPESDEPVEVTVGSRGTGES